MRVNEILVERVINAFDEKTKLQYGNEVWDLLQKSYSKVPGGFGSADDIPDLIKKGDLWKIVTRAGKVTAVGIYRDQFGRKSIAAGTNGTRQGLADYMMIKNADVQMSRAWAEVSGAPEAIMAKSGCKPIPAKFAHILSKKEILEINPDGYHYTRLIQGEPHEKIMYGSISMTPELVQHLVAMGIQLHELPTNFKS